MSTPSLNVSSKHLDRRNSLLTRWRAWATIHPISASLLAGLIATHISTVLGFWMGSFGLARLDWNTANGLVYVPDADPLAQWVIGGLMHYTDGILFGVLYGVAFHPRMPWANSELGNGLKGLAFGTVLALVALTVLTPLVYAPAAGNVAGVFRTNFGWEFVLGVFIFHWVYGLHLGLIYSPFDRTDARWRSRKERADTVSS